MPGLWQRCLPQIAPVDYYRSMSYTVKEIYYTLQGEGAHTGRVGVFLRFTGCNLWSGRQADRATAVCNFCDTDFVGTDGPAGGKFATADELAAAVERVWMTRGELPRISGDKGRFVVCTGGEPLLQLDRALIDALHAVGFIVAVETNGTLPPPPGIDWLCVSPKAGAPLVVTHGDELKLVFPQPGIEPADFELLDFANFYLQPMDGPHRAANEMLAAQYCLTHPQWRLSLQMHKLLGMR